MTYNELLIKIRNTNDFQIYKSNYSSEYFGSFLIELLYKNSLKIKIINDKGIIEILISKRINYRKKEIPFEYIVNIINENLSAKKVYTFTDINSAYDFLTNNLNILDEIINRNLFLKVYKTWK